MRRIVLVCCVLLTFYGTADSGAEQAAIPRIGYVSTGDSSAPPALLRAFREGLRDLGYIEGKNILVEYRYANGKEHRIPGLVAELVQLKLDVIVVPTLTGIRAAKRATHKIPIVMVSSEDPVANGFVDSLARPGGNVTGLTRLQRELSGKRLELLSESVTRLSRAGILWDADSRTAAIGLKEYEAAAGALKIHLHPLPVRDPKSDLEAAFRTAAREHLGALVTITTAALFRNQRQIADLAIGDRLPSMFEGSTWVDAGGLMSYSTNDAEVFRRAAVYVDKILKGAKPADLPVEQPTKFEMVINLKTAKQIGLTIPGNVLARADRVIR